jgi:hypothetical protein
MLHHPSLLSHGFSWSTIRFAIFVLYSHCYLRHTAANLLKPMLARGELRCIGATTLTEYRQHIEKDPAFERRFQQVRWIN